jgi:hypothetical protein
MAPIVELKSYGQSFTSKHYHIQACVVNIFLMICPTRAPDIYSPSLACHWSSVANMASYAISSSLILVIHDNMIIGTNLIVLACLYRHF